MTLTAKHVGLLRIAAGRPDAHLVPPERLVGAALHRMAARLLELGVAEPVRVAAGPLQWFRTELNDATGLRLTQAGRVAARDL